ncbi:MAG: hypothetical protein ACXVUE_15385 [Solirubrobacteraceae bacterium]
MTLLKLLWGSICSVVVLVSLVVGQAAASSHWALRYPPTPAGFSYGDLDGVSCVSGAACVAVGWFRDADGTEFPLVERWSAGRWRADRTPGPNRSIGARLFGVSCTSATACTAVGSFDNANGTFALAERWDGRTWTLQHVPQSSFPDGSALLGISCPSRRACTAVGSAEDPEDMPPVIDHWNGTRWVAQRAQKSAGAGGGLLYDVSCVAGGSCVAVGAFLDPNTDCVTPWVQQQQNGKLWTIRSSPVFGDCWSDSNGLSGISCPSDLSCTAVGYNDDPFGRFGRGAPVAERLSRGTWVLQNTPSITYLEDPWGGGGWLQDISCTSPRSCIAAGAASSTIITRPLLERWNGQKWKLEQTSQLPLDGALNSVSCPSVTICTAVGFDDSGGDSSDVPIIESTFKQGSKLPVGLG